MNIYKKIFLRKVPEFQALTEEQQEASIKVHNHKYIAMYFATLLVTTVYPAIPTMVFAISTLVIMNFVNATVGYILFWVTLPYNIAISVYSVWSIYRRAIKKDTNQDIFCKLFDLFTKPCLYNYKVVTKKDWKKLKETNKARYIKCRTEASNHQCYSVTHELAQLISKPDVKIVWIFMDSFGFKCGHAILVKGDYVYDSNMRRTYKKSEYYRYFKVQEFLEFDYDEWQTYGELRQSEAWQAFAIWCKQLGGKRDTDDEQG